MWRPKPAATEIKLNFELICLNCLQTATVTPLSPFPLSIDSHPPLARSKKKVKQSISLSIDLNLA